MLIERFEDCEMPDGRIVKCKVISKDKSSIVRDIEKEKRQARIKKMKDEYEQIQKAILHLIPEGWKYKIVTGYEDGFACEIQDYYIKINTNDSEFRICSSSAEQLILDTVKTLESRALEIKDSKNKEKNKIQARLHEVFLKEHLESGEGVADAQAKMF